MILGNRYIHDNITEWELNPTHIKYREQFLKKIETGHYRTETVSVCVCGGKNFEQLTAKDRFGLPFGNVICKSCGLLICSPRLQEKSLPEFYDKEYHGLVFGQEEVANFEHMVDKQQGMMIFGFLRKHIGVRKHLEVAEIGAGVGNNLKAIIEEAKKQAIDVTACGCEYSEACVRFGKEKYGLNMVQGSTDALVKLNKKFDLVIMSHILEHFTDPYKELMLVKNMLKEDGMVYVEVPGVLDLHNKPVYQCDFLRYTVLAHMYNFSLGTLTNILELSGFELIEGTEFVRSIFKLSSDKKNTVLNYYHKIIEYLRNQEQGRRIFYQLSVTQANLVQHITRLSDELSGEVAKNRAYTQKNFDFLSGNRSLINKSAEDLLKMLTSIQKEFSNLLIEKTKQEDELIKKYGDLIREKQNIEIEFTKQFSEFRSEKLRSDNEYQRQIEQLHSDYQAAKDRYQKQIEQLGSDNQAAMDRYQKQIEQLHSDNQAVEAWLKDHIVQILTEKKKSEDWLRKQNETLKQEKLNTENRLHAAQSKYDNLNHWHNVIINSLSWKITAPIRKMKEIIFPKWKG